MRIIKIIKRNTINYVGTIQYDVYDLEINDNKLIATIYTAEKDISKVAKDFIINNRLNDVTIMYDYNINLEGDDVS